MAKVPKMTDDKLELNRVGSLCTPDPHAELLDAWLSRDFSNFSKVLEQPDVSPDHWFDDPHLGTCLYLACKKDDGAEYAEALIKAGAQPNDINRVHKKAPIHVAAESGRYDILKILVSNPATDINILDSFGNTPLHLLAKKKFKGEEEEVINKYKRCIELLLNQDDINPNIVNRKGHTAINLAAQNDAKEMVQTILEHAGDDLDVDKKAFNGKCAREIVLEKYPELTELLPESGKPEGIKQTVDISTLFQYLYGADCDSFISAINIFPNGEIMDKNDGRRTLLQHCAEEGFKDAVCVLLDKGANPNATCLAKPCPPAVLACYGGHSEVLAVFLSHGPEFLNLTAETGRGTALHAVLVNSPMPSNSTAYKNYKTCLDLLLKYLPNLKLDINAIDVKGNTALHYAAKNEDDYAVLNLLKHGAYIGIKNVFGDPPLANISPRMLEAFLNDCLDTNGEFPREDTYEVTFSYTFLVPPKGSCLQERRNSHVTLMIPLHNNSQNPSESTARQQTSISTANTETEPLLYISRSRDLRYLLKHPVFTSFLDLKWHRIRIFFYINLIFYILFVALLTLYILFSYGESRMTDSNKGTSNTTLINNNATQELANESEKIIKSNASSFFRAILIIFLILLILRELFQFFVSPKKYLYSPENYLEILLVLSTATILFCNWALTDAKPHFSAIGILLSWAELVLLIGRHPRLSTNIEMFKTVSWNFLKFLAWYAILIVAFALSFYSLFRDCGGAAECGEEGDSDENFFLSPGMSVFKTVVMLTGEFDAASIPFVSFPGTSHMVFVLFVFLIAIVLFNLLNGLAVSDTQAIRDDAEVVSYISRVKLMSYIESMFQSSSIPLIDTLKQICCCWPVGNYSLKSVTNRVRLFPDTVPNNKIWVLPNQGARILFAIHQKKSEEVDETKCCPARCGGYTLDPEIVKRAMEILNTRGKSSEMDKVMELLEQSQRQLKEFHRIMEYNQKKLEEYEFKFESMKMSHKETELMLEKILDTLLRPNSPNSSIDSK